MILKSTMIALSLAAGAAHAQGPSQLAQAADQLASAVEILDEALHNQPNTPPDVIAVVHHFEDTANELAQLTLTAPAEVVAPELEHLRSDYPLVRDALLRNAWLLSDSDVAFGFVRVRIAFARLDRH